MSKISNGSKQYYANGSNIIRRMVIAADFAIATAILLVYIRFFPKLVPLFFHAQPRMTIIVAIFAMMVAQYLSSTIIHLRQVTFKQVLYRSVRLAAIHSACLFLCLRLICDGGGFFRFTIIYFVSFCLVLIASRLLELLILRKYRIAGGNTRSVVFVGNDPAVCDLYRKITALPFTGYHIKGYYADHDIEKAPEGFKRLGSYEELHHFMHDNMEFKAENAEPNAQAPSRFADDIFCCLSHNDADMIVEIMRFCDKNVIQFYYLPRMFANYKLNLISEPFMGQTLFTNRKEPLTLMSNRILKRGFDLLVSGFICLCMLPLFPIIALLIKLQSPGPVFFRQARTGFLGETFQCLKFRSMHVNKDADTVQATANDPRKFAFGSFMRKTNIDEFPQFINVLKGDMSIVGPRPHMLYHTEIYSKLIDKYMVRHFSKPGITGWAQVTGYRGETKELWQMEERIHRDIWYNENWTFFLDLKIIAMTAKSLFVPDKHAY